MMVRKLSKRARVALLFGGLALAILPTIALSATNTIEVPTTTADVQYLVVTPDSMKPDHCNSITVDKVMSGSGTYSGTSDNELILAQTPNDIVDGAGGNDCIVIGEGSGIVDGGGGTDICIGGPSITFINCETTYPA